MSKIEGYEHMIVNYRKGDGKRDVVGKVSGAAPVKIVDKSSIEYFESVGKYRQAAFRAMNKKDYVRAFGNLEKQEQEDLKAGDLEAALDTCKVMLDICKTTGQEDVAMGIYPRAIDYERRIKEQDNVTGTSEVQDASDGSAYNQVLNTPKVMEGVTIEDRIAVCEAKLQLALNSNRLTHALKLTDKLDRLRSKKKAADEQAELENMNSWTYGMEDE